MQRFHTRRKEQDSELQKALAEKRWIIQRDATQDEQR